MVSPTQFAELKASQLKPFSIQGYPQDAPEYQTWADRWLAYPVICLFPADRREEWLGDLYEVRNDLIDKQYPRWLVNFHIAGRTLILVYSALKISLIDLIVQGFRQRS